MAAERYLSWRIPDSRVGNDIGTIDKNPVPSIYVPGQNEDKDFLVNLLDTKLSYSLGEDDILKPMQLGKRSESMNQSYKCRPLRFSVRSFQVKRELLKASMSLRETNDEMFSNIYFTPDLTKCQRAEAFKLREERRYRTNELYESNLKISHAVL